MKAINEMFSLEIHEIDTGESLAYIKNNNAAFTKFRECDNPLGNDTGKDSLVAVCILICTYVRIRIHVFQMSILQ